LLTGLLLLLPCIRFTPHDTSGEVLLVVQLRVVSASQGQVLGGANTCIATGSDNTWMKVWGQKNPWLPWSGQTTKSPCMFPLTSVEGRCL